jgi:hypothetical protein
VLTACAMGLGSCVIGATLSALNKPEVKAEFGIQADFLAVAPIIVGYPSADLAGCTPQASRSGLCLSPPF